MWARSDKRTSILLRPRSESSEEEWIVVMWTRSLTGCTLSGFTHSTRLFPFSRSDRNHCVGMDDGGMDLQSSAVARSPRRHRVPDASVRRGRRPEVVGDDTESHFLVSHGCQDVVHAFFSPHSLWGIAPKQTKVPSFMTAQLRRQTANATAPTGVESRAMLK